MHHRSEVPEGLLRCRTAFTIDALPRFETPALDALKVIPEFRAGVTHPAQGAKKFAHHQFLHFRVVSVYINLDASTGTSL